MAKCGKVVISNLMCPVCEHIMPIPRHVGCQRKDGHIKDMFCPYCGKKRKFVEHKGNAIKTMAGEVLI